ncbi:unnamed protein product [Peniophora sp. CBMAI 1063]|nr:unnamed protein product [Peniophora sp. CBMAI 1063]
MDLTATLPAKILAHVFACVQAVDPITRNRHNAPGWMRVTAICRRWRRVAIADATLWAHWTPDLCLFGEGFELFIERSKDALLSISNDKLTYEESSNVLACIAINVDRIRTLYLEGVDYDDDLHIAKMLTRNVFSSLVSCHLRNYLGSDWINDPLRLFEGLAPRLQHLVLHLPGLPFGILDWQSPIYDNLVSLDLTMLREQHIFDTNDIVDALRRMTKLSSLAIAHWEGSDTQSPDEDSDEELSVDVLPNSGTNRQQRVAHGPFAVLARLELFVIVARPDYFPRLLPKLSLPPTASVALASHLPARNTLSTREYTSLGHGLISDYRTAPAAPYHAAYLAFDTFPKECVVLKLTHQPLSRSAYPGRYPHSVFGVKQRRHNEDYDLALHLAEMHILNFLPHLSVDRVTVLTLNNLPTHLDACLLRPFTGTTHLRIIGPLKKSTLSFLYKPEDLVLPNLQEIDFADICGLKDLLACFKSVSHRGWHQEYFRALEKILRVRREAGHPLRRVYVHAQDDIQLANEDRLNDVGFGHWRLDQMRCVLALLDGFPEVQIVENNVDVFMNNE